MSPPVSDGQQARLRRRDDGKAFCVATYHMPCLFGSDIKCQVMTMHASWRATPPLRLPRPPSRASDLDHFILGAEVLLGLGFHWWCI